MWFPDSDYAKEFNDRISKLADRIVKNTVGIDAFPTETQTHILDAVCQFGGTDAQVLKTLNNLLVCKSMSKNIAPLKCKFINDHNVCLQTLGSKTPSEAVSYVKDKKLTSANFTYFKKFNDAHLGQLISANFTCFKKFNDAHLGQLIAANPQLTKLSIKSKQITGDKLAELIEILPDLESLTLNRCEVSGDRLSEAIASLSKLKTINLDGCQLFSEDKFFDSIGDNSPIEQLSFKGSHLSFRRLPDALDKLTKLQNISLSFDTQLPGDSIAAVVKKLPPQKKLDFSFCFQISEANMEEVLEAHPGVEKLSLWQCRQITEVQFLDKAPNLQELNLSDCEGILEAEIVKVPLLLPKLKTLWISGCDQISDETIADIKAKYPHLKLIEG